MEREALPPLRVTDLQMTPYPLHFNYLLMITLEMTITDIPQIFWLEQKEENPYI